MTDKAGNAFPLAASIGSLDSFFVNVGDDGATPGAGNPRRVAASTLAAYFATATLAAGTLTTSQPMTLTQAWNDGAVTFRGKENVFTITAAAVGSTVERWLGGAAGTTVLASLSSIGGLTLADILTLPVGSAAAPSLRFATSATSGFYQPAGNQVWYSANSAAQFRMLQNEIHLRSSLYLGWTSGEPDGTFDLALTRDAANTLAQRNGTASQAFNLYKTWTDASNYERLALAYNGDHYWIKTEEAGTGVSRHMYIGPSGSGSFLSFVAGGSNRWSVGGAGHLTADSDNTYDIGAAAATRPRNLHLGGYLAGSVQSLSGAGAVNLTTYTTAFTSTGAGDALTLADGVVGQFKCIVHVADGGSGVLTPSNLFNGTTITFTNLGESCLLQFIGTEWHVISLNGAVLA